MSIIADTLKRLQAQSDDPTPNPSAELDPRQTFNKGEGSGRHRKDSPFGFLMVMVGMTITLGGLAVSAFWIGGHLDFGLATNTQAHMNDRRSLPNAPDLFEDPVLVDQSSETRIAAASEPTQSPQNLPLLDNDEQHQGSVMSTDSVSIPPSPPHETTTPSRFEDETINPSSTEAMTSKASPDQQSFSGTMDQPSMDKKESIAPSLSVSEEPSSVMISSELPTSPTDYPAIDFSVAVADQTDEPESPNLVAKLSEEEIIQAEEFVKTSRPLTDSAPRPTALAALKARRESMNHDVQAAIPLPLSPATRLRHAQQLIQTGEYEDAVELLSPLFHDPPVKWQPWFWMGTALLGKGDMEQADQFLLSGLARNDKIPQLWVQRALVAQQRGDYQLAIHELRQAESLGENLPQIHLNMGYAYEQLGNDRLANQYYGKFLKLSEGQPKFFSTRKKLFARLTQQTPIKKLSPLPSTKP